MNHPGHSSQFGLGQRPPHHSDPYFVAEANINEKYDQLGGMYISSLNTVIIKLHVKQRRRPRRVERRVSS